MEVHLPDRAASRRHALLEYSVDGGATLTDLGSTNATYLNGIRVTTPQPVRNGDELRFGDTVLVYMDLAEPSTGDPLGEAEASSEMVETRRLEADKTMPPLPITVSQIAPARRGVAYLVGESPALAYVTELVGRCAPLDTNVLVFGESGTGKELVAEALHRLGPRRDAPFVVVNCATLEPALLESELFGHERGAFTGAVARKMGKLELVRNGTLFLDEIGELPLEAQAKLLRAIDRREFTRLGGHEVLRAHARFVAATHRDLPALVRESRFREDLYFRLRVVEIRIAPLRDRPEDLRPLVAHFLAELRKKIPTRVKDLTPAAYECLLRYRFPGNVRELRNVIERCLIFCERDMIDVADLPPEIRDANGSSPQRPEAAFVAGDPVATEEAIGTLEEAERVALQRALEVANWNKSKAARILAIDRNTLHAKIKRHKLAP